jgi:hypothetical protein
MTMSFEHKPTADLVQIAAAGGGIILDAAYRQTPDLIQIAAAGAKGNARLVFKGMTYRQQADLIQIAAAGKGSVQFEG